MGRLDKKSEKKNKSEIKSKEELKKHNEAVINAILKDLSESEKALQINEKHPEENTITDIEILPQLKMESKEISEDIELTQNKGTIENLEKIFENETGKHAIWRGKETKSFIQWKKKRQKS